MAHYGYSASHLNGNVLCAIDIETTGLEFTKHDIIQIAIIPIGLDLRPTSKIGFFHTLIQPRRPENIDEKAERINRGRIAEAMTHGLEASTAEDRLREYFEKLPIPFGKKIVPLGANFQFDRDFIMDWLGGPLSYQEFFRDDFRDVQKMALMINDMASWHEEQIPFPKVNLKYLCNILQVENPNAHDAVGDCLATAECYRKLLRWKDEYVLARRDL